MVGFYGKQNQMNVPADYLSSLISPTNFPAASGSLHGELLRFQPGGMKRAGEAWTQGRPGLLSLWWIMKEGTICIGD